MTLHLMLQTLEPDPLLTSLIGWIVITMVWSVIGLRQLAAQRGGLRAKETS